MTNRRRRTLTDQHGISLIELLIASFLTGIVLLGLSSLYLATTRAFAESNSQAMVQRQGTLALDEIARHVRTATAVSNATCNGVAALQVTTAAGTFCYYADTAGELCQFTNGACRDLLAGAPKHLHLMQQPNPNDPRCPTAVAAGSRCFTATAVSTTGATVAFTIEDAGGTNALAFSMNMTCAKRNC